LKAYHKDYRRPETQEDEDRQIALFTAVLTARRVQKERRRRIQQGLDPLPFLKWKAKYKSLLRLTSFNIRKAREAFDQKAKDDGSEDEAEDAVRAPGIHEYVIGVQRRGMQGGWLLETRTTSEGGGRRSSRGRLKPPQPLRRVLRTKAEGSERRAAAGSGIPTAEKSDDLENPATTLAERRDPRGRSELLRTTNHIDHGDTTNTWKTETGPGGQLRTSKSQLPRAWIHVHPEELLRKRVDPCD
jgi:hypothetical protein